MTLLMAAMYVLFETSILASWLLDRRAMRTLVSASGAAP